MSRLSDLLAQVEAGQPDLARDLRRETDALSRRQAGREALKVGSGA